MYGPEDIIIKQNENSNDIYFILEGNIEIFHYLCLTKFKVLSKSGYFGEIGFFLNIPRTASAKSRNFSELFALTRDDFLEMIKTMPKDKEKFEIIERNFINYGISVLKLKCYLCHRDDHISLSCDRYLISKQAPEKINLKQILCNGKNGSFRERILKSNLLKRYPSISTS